MNVSITEIETESLRCPDTLIKLSDRATGAAVNLIQTPNYTGKTTIIELIMGTLTGGAKNWSTTEVSDFQGSLKKETGKFRVAIKIEEQNKPLKEISLVLNFDFVHNSIEISTFNNEGFQPGWIAPKELIPFLNDKCVDVFVFLGDKTDEVVTRDLGDAQPAIETFFGTVYIEELKGEIVEAFNAKMLGIKKNQSHDNTTAKTEALLGQWVIMQGKLVAAEKKLKGKKTTILKKFGDIDKIYQKILNKVENIEKREEMALAKIDAFTTLNQVSREAFALLRNPFSFSKSIHNEITNLKNTLDDFELPGYARSFFENWVDTHADCICGDPLTEQKKEIILKTVDGFLSDEDITIVESIKNEVNDNLDEVDLTKELKNKMRELEDANQVFESKSTSLNNHIRELEKSVKKKDKDLIAKHATIVTDKTIIENQYENLTKKMDYEVSAINFPDKCLNLTVATAIVEKLGDELGKLKNMKKVVKAKETLLKVLDETALNSLTEYKNYLVNEMNIKLDKFLTEGSECEVMNIDKNVQLGWQGKEKKKGSGAQNLITLYSFATSILERTNINFPLIVDHPVTNMDYSSRTHIGQKLGEISHQFIGFIINSEKDYFLDALELSQEVRCISFFAKIKGHEGFLEQLKNHPPELKHETHNGCVSYDRDFFHNNQMGTNV